MPCISFYWLIVLLEPLVQCGIEAVRVNILVLFLILEEKTFNLLLSQVFVCTGSLSGFGSSFLFLVC